MVRLSPLLLLTGAWCMAAAGPDLPAQLTLSEALNIALSNSTTIREAMAQLDETSGRYQQSRSALLPQIEVAARQSIRTVVLTGFGIELSSAQGLIGPFGSMDVRALLTQDLVNIASVRAWQSYRSRRQSSRLLVDDSREIVALNVVAAYLAALKTKATRDTLTEQTRLARDLYSITRERVSQGVAAELDANRALQQVNSLNQQRLESEQSYVAAKLDLANTLHARVTSDFEVVDEAAYGSGTAPDRDTAVKTALASRADYRAAEASVTAAELQVRSINATRLPTLRVTLDDGPSGSTPVHNANTYRAQGSISFPIFTGGRIRGEIEEAEGSLREARTLLDRNRSQIETDVLAAVSGVEWALRALETSEGNVKLSREEVELTRQRFTQGISDNTEVVNAQTRLTQADDAHIRALYTLGLARANLARATGLAEKTYRR